MKCRSAVGLLVLLSLSAFSESQLKDSFVPREVATPYKDRNLCSFMSVEGLGYNLYTCTTPYVQEYCGTKTKNVFDCCPGFEKQGDECVSVLSVWRSVGNRAGAAGKSMKEAFSRNPLIEMYNRNITTKTFSAFLPVNNQVLKSANYDVISGSSENPNPAYAAVVKGRVYSSDFKNGQTLTSLYKDQKLKVNIFSNGLMFVECAAIVLPDNDAVNGVLHVTSGIIPPHVTASFDRSTLRSALSSLPSASAFLADLPDDVKTLLGDASAKWMTLFVPTNDAWTAAKAKYTKNADDVAVLVRNHVITKMICSQSITKRTTRLGKTLAGEYIGADCPSNDFKRFILDGGGNQVAINTADIMAGNGVIHIIGGALGAAKLIGAPEVLTYMSGKYEISRTIKELENCDLLIKGDTRYILLIPLNKAYTWFENYKKFSSQWKQFQTDAEYRCNVLRFHVLKLGDLYAKLPASWWNQIAFETNYNPGRITWATNYYVKYRYGSELFFHYARVVNMNAISYRGGYIYFIDRINVIPEMTMMQYLASRTDLSVVLKQTQISKLNLLFDNSPPRFLYIVPRNLGWQARDELEWVNHRMINFLKLHLVSLYLWGDDIGYFHRETYSTHHSAIHFSGQRVNFQLRFKRALDGNMYIGYDNLAFEEWALVLEFNRYCYDGMIWVVDWPLTCPEHICADGKSLLVPDVDMYTVYASACMVEEGVATRKQFKVNSKNLAEKNLDKCRVYKIPVIEVYRLYDPALGD